MRMKMWCLMIRIRRNDKIKGKRLQGVLLDFLMKAGISGATVWTGVNGFGKRGRSSFHIEGVSVNTPLLIEVIDERVKLEPLLPEIKILVDDNGLVTLHEIETL